MLFVITPRKSVEDLQELIKSVRDRGFPYVGREEKERNWSSYDRAQINEIAEVLETIRDIVDEASSRVEAKKRGPGRPAVPPSDVVKVMLMQAYFGMPNRVAQGFLRLFGEKLGIGTRFSYKTIERGYDPERSRAILEEVMRIINDRGNSMEKVFSTDGTGDPTSMKINYETRRREQRERKGNKSDDFPHTRGKHDFQYSVFSTGIHTKIIAGFSTTEDHSIGELSHFPAVMAQTAEMCPRMEVMLGDALYSSRNACSTVDSYGVRPYFLPKSNVKFSAKGVESWKMMLYGFMDNTQEWLETYHMRSISESVNSMIKRKMPFKIRKRLPNRKRMEEYLKVNMHNLRQLNYLKHTNPELLKTYEGINSK